MSDQYTPTTDEVREAYLDRKDFEDALSFVDRRGDEEAGAEFNRWLASVKAEAWEQGADSAYYDPEIRGQVNYPDNPYREQEAP